MCSLSRKGVTERRQIVSDRLQRTQLRLIRGNKRQSMRSLTHFERKKMLGVEGGKGKYGMVFRALSNSSERGGMKDELYHKCEDEWGRAWKLGKPGWDEHTCVL